MANIGIIYLIRLHGVSKYVGFTICGLRTRWKRHWYAATRGGRGALHRSMRKNGDGAFTIEEIYQSPDIKHTLNVMENKFIIEHKTLFSDGGYNLTEGGEGAIGHVVSTEARRKMSEAHLGKVHSEEHKLANSKAALEYYKNNSIPETTRRKISENNIRLQAEGKIGMRGKKHSINTKQKMSENNAMNNPIHVKKMKDAKRGIQYLNQNGKRMMAVPNTEKWSRLISLGYKIGY